MSRPDRVGVALLLAVALACGGGPPSARLDDSAGHLDAEGRRRIEKQLALTWRETGVDVHVVLTSLRDGASVEQVAAERLSRVGAVRPALPGRDLLLLHDAAGGRLRVEVGYALEPVFTDALVGELIHSHTRFLLDTGAVETALQLTLRMLRDRLRDASLLGVHRPPSSSVSTAFASGGAGASDAAPVGARRLRAFERAARSSGPRAADAVEATYERYLLWLARGRFEPGPLFTQQSRSLLAAWPMTPGYLAHVLDREWGRSFAVLERGDHALLYCLDDPHLPPHFFVLGDAGWAMDLAAEVREVVDVAGGTHSWGLRGGPDAAPFRDALVVVNGLLRVRGGDNRATPL